VPKRLRPCRQVSGSRPRAATAQRAPEGRPIAGRPMRGGRTPEISQARKTARIGTNLAIPVAARRSFLPLLPIGLSSICLSPARLRSLVSGHWSSPPVSSRVVRTHSADASLRSSSRPFADFRSYSVGPDISIVWRLLSPAYPIAGKSSGNRYPGLPGPFRPHPRSRSAASQSKEERR